MRLIDAHKLQKAIYEHKSVRSITKDKVVEIIKEQPTVDEINVCGNCRWARLAHGFERHGHWIIDTKFGADVMSRGQMVICSECDKGIFWGKQNYCPNCGARMDEESDDDYRE